MAPSEVNPRAKKKKSGEVAPPFGAEGGSFGFSGIVGVPALKPGFASVGFPEFSSFFSGAGPQPLKRDSLTHAILPLLLRWQSLWAVAAPHPSDVGYPTMLLQIFVAIRVRLAEGLNVLSIPQ